MSDIKIDLDQVIPNLLENGRPMKATAPRVICDKCGNQVLVGEDRDMDMRYVFVEALVSHKAADAEEHIGMHKLAVKFSDMGGQISLSPSDMTLVKKALGTYGRAVHVKGAAYIALENGKKDEVQNDEKKSE